MKSENIKLMLLTAIFTAFSCVTQAKPLTARQIYTYAKDSNFDALKTLGNAIDTEDEDGNTALCLALNDGDAKAYRTLQEYGADTTVKCNITYGLSSGDGSYNYYRRGRYYPASRSSGTFLGMGPVGWTVTGVVVAAGAGVAIAAGGGGGGGSSSSSGKKEDDKKPEDDSVTKYLDDEPITDKDKGQEIVGKTVSINSFEKEEDLLKTANNKTIKKIVESQSTVVGISSESSCTSNAMSIGGDKKAEIIIAERGNGDIYGIRGPQNYVTDDTDSEEEDGFLLNAIATHNGKATGNITIRNTGAGTGNIYGLQSKGNIYVGNVVGIQEIWEDDYELDESVPLATGNILIENINSNKNVYGISSQIEAINAESDDNAKVTGNITIKNIGNGNVYGIKTSKDNTRNAGATENSEATAVIDINNTGNGNVYGMNEDKNYPDGDLYNAQGGERKSHEGDYKEDYPAKATAIINIENTGTGNAYGIKSLTNTYNAHSYYNSTATGKIRVSNNGKGNAYGIYGNHVIKNASAHSEGSDYYATAKGYVNILNKSSGNAYGLYSNNPGNMVMNNSEDDGEKQISVIELANIGNGLVVGMYSKDGNIENSGDIKIHNLAGGKAVGIYADGTTTVENSGNITIDRTNYKDDKATDKTSDDVTYKKKSDKGGKAIGIYGADGTNIINSGTIKISDAKEAYGIYAEGTNVTNTGTIIIDGDNNHKNAIKLNGGKLLQDGVIKVGSDWDDIDPCDDVTCGANATCSVVGNSGVCQCNAGYEGNTNTGCTLIAEETSSDIGKTLTGSFVSGSSYDDGEGDDYYEAFNNSNVTVNRSSDNAVIGIRFYSEESYNAETLLESLTSSTLVNVTQRGNGGVYGLQATKHPQQTSNEIIVRNASADGAGNATASIIVTHAGNGDAYGIYADYTDNSSLSSEVLNAFTEASTDTEHFQNISSVSKGEIQISNTKNGKVYGIQATYSINANAETEIGENQTVEAVADGLINLSNTGKGDIYGMKATGYAANAVADTYVEFSSYNKTASTTSTGRIRLDNNGNGNIYGIYSNNSAENAVTYLGSESTTGTIIAKATGVINLINKGDGYAYGIYAPKASNKSNTNATSTIEMVNKGNGLSVGIYSKDGKVENSGEIKIHNLGNGKAIGIYADGTTNVTNSGTITIDRSSYTDDMATETTSDDVTYNKKSDKGGMAIGIYGAAGSSISNSGTIKISGASTAYGIYAEEGATVNNSGTITIDGDNGHENAVYLHGGKLLQNGVLSVTTSGVSGATTSSASLDLNDFGGTVVASDTSQFIVEGAISGDLAINNSVVENGFDTIYKVSGMIDAADTNGLNLYSQSALFDAALENDTDAVMTMKSFDSVVENGSVADFLQNNYTSSNNEDLFKALKSAETVAELNSSIDDLFGKDMLSSMAFEDLSMLREVSFDMNNRLFEKEGSFALGESISPSGYDNKLGSVGRYSLNGFNNGKTSFGLGISITDVRTTEGKKDNRRFDRSFMMSLPVGHKTHGFELISTPKLGYTHGTYERKGLNNMTYDGKIQKRMVALMNEARYPLDFAGIRVSPSTEFNMIGYNIKGHEDSQQYALRMKSQNHYSFEAGLGLMAQKEFKPYKDHKFNVKGGVAIYHEFADPYELDVAMSGMSGTYRLHDEKRSDNRAVARFGFSYKLKDNLDISASLLENIDREYRSDAKIDLNYHF